MKTLTLFFSLLLTLTLTSTASADTEAECRDAGKASGQLFAEQYTNVLLKRYAGETVQRTVSYQRTETTCGEVLTKACYAAMWEYLYFKGGESVSLILSDWNGAFSSWHEVLSTACSTSHEDNFDRMSCPSGTESVGGKFCKNGGTYLVGSDGDFWEVERFVYEYGAPEAIYMVKYAGDWGQPGAVRAIRYSDLADVGAPLNNGFEVF